MPPEPTRFHTAARYYLQGRPTYAAALIRRVVQLCGLDPTCRLLDLGCGPGQLALAFAPFVGEVVGIDPEPEMLRIAGSEAARTGRVIEFREGSSHEVGADLGRFRLVVIGRAFHWMDRQETLVNLDRIIQPEGAVVLFDDHHPKVPDNRWSETYEGLIDRYAEADTARAARHALGWLSHEAVLLDSPFPHLERISMLECRSTPVERFVDRALSLSSVSQGQIGARADDLAREIHEVMGRFARDGRVTEVVESEALIARRQQISQRPARPVGSCSPLSSLT
jgi:SAM-dependent methyltransferase